MAVSNNNSIVSLKEIPFSLRTNQDKLATKQLGPPRPNLAIKQLSSKAGKSYTRRFSKKWYERKRWLAGCDVAHALFCFPCLLFHPEGSTADSAAWTATGVTDMMHLSAKIKKHEQSKLHMYSCLKFSAFGRVNVTAQLEEGHGLPLRPHEDEGHTTMRAPSQQEPKPNSVGSLLRNPFNRRTLEEQLQIKELGPDQPCISITQKDYRGNKRSFNRFFSPKWYSKKSWLTGCSQTNALFCFPCLLFPTAWTEKAWTYTGVRDLRHLSEKIQKHECAKTHMGNAVKLALLGSTDVARQLDDRHRTYLRKRNQEVDKNRYVLSKVIDCVKFCGAFELPLSSHSETSGRAGVFRGLVDFLASLDSVLEEHLNTAAVFKGNTKKVQNELLDCMMSVLKDRILEEVKTADCLAIQVVETADIYTHCQLALVLRYIDTRNHVQERFFEFINLENATADTVAAVLLERLSTILPKGQESKLIAQAYDGVAVMRGATGGVHRKVKDVYRCAHYVHSYAHQLNVIMQQATSHLPGIRTFFSYLGGFDEFFSLSLKQTTVLHQVWVRRLPGTPVPRWKFHSASTVYEHKEDLLRCFQSIRDSGDFDPATVREAGSLMRILKDEDFCFFLALFHKIIPHVVLLSKQLQKKNIDSSDITRVIQRFTDSMQRISGSLQETEGQQEQPHSESVQETEGQQEQPHSESVQETEGQQEQPHSESVQETEGQELPSVKLKTEQEEPSHGGSVQQPSTENLKTEEQEEQLHSGSVQEQLTENLKTEEQEEPPCIESVQQQPKEELKTEQEELPHGEFVQQLPTKRLKTEEQPYSEFVQERAVQEQPTEKLKTEEQGEHLHSGPVQKKEEQEELPYGEFMQQPPTKRLKTEQEKQPYGESVQETTGQEQQLCGESVERQPPKKRTTKGLEEKQRLAVEVCDAVWSHVKERFSFSKHLLSATLFQGDLFPYHRMKFPQSALQASVEAYPTLSMSKLKTELSLIYRNDDFNVCSSALTLFHFFMDNNLQSTFTETVGLLRLLITTPMTTPESERCFSTLRRIKAFVKNAVTQEHLNALAMLSIEKDLIKNIPDFNRRVMERFSNQMHRRAKFLYM